MPKGQKTYVELVCDKLNARLGSEYWDDIVGSLPDCELVGKDRIDDSVILFYVIDGEAVAYDRPYDWVYPVKSMGGIPGRIYSAYDRRGLI